jgi:hypothetical protein
MYLWLTEQTNYLLDFTNGVIEMHNTDSHIATQGVAYGGAGL